VWTVQGRNHEGAAKKSDKNGGDKGHRASYEIWGTAKLQSASGADSPRYATILILPSV